MNATAPKAAPGERPDHLRVSREQIAALVPTILGFMISRSGVIVSSYNSYASTDNGLFTDGSTLIVMMPLLIALLCLGITNAIVSKTVTITITLVCIACESLALFGIAFLECIPGSQGIEYLVLSSVSTLSAWLCMFYWLRRCRNTTCAVAIIVVFSAFAISEALLYVACFLPRELQCGMFGALCLVQYALVRMARKRPLPETSSIVSKARGYFHFAEKKADSVSFLAVIALGTFMISIVIGILKGFPSGEPIRFGAFTRLAYTLITISLLASFIVGMMRGKNMMTVYMWIAMQVLGALALIAFAVFPESLDIGAIFVNAMNILMSCFMSYLIIAFSSHGHRDFYYYAFGAWAVFLLPRSLMRVASIFTFGDLPSTVLPTAIAGSLLLLSAQFVFVQFLGIERDETKESRAAAKNVQRLLGIREEAAPGTEMRKAIVRESAKAMQEQFMLSNRETEVLALYAMGLTQAKIAEELRIAPGTAHTHVKRIYSKTDLHSRQAILDYIEQYAD
ncbi:LuxR family transcriptional regulator [Slackia sp. CM382]|uniref:helix-turn-helix transcriptional regulator n=1 Tax=Slackia sp. CM382 TaxID=1111137 RepID=UPI0006884142|nr:LuxR family transcriptional regulator [Slackia sp. CM382]